MPSITGDIRSAGARLARVQEDYERKLGETHLETLGAAVSQSCYARLHGDAELYASGYDDRALDRWADKCRAWASRGRDVFVYFDNDMKGYAPHDAMALLTRLSPAGSPASAHRSD